MQTIKLSQLKEVMLGVSVVNFTLYTVKPDYNVFVRFNDDDVKIIRLQDRLGKLDAIDCNYNSIATSWDSEVTVTVTHTKEYMFEQEMV